MQGIDVFASLLFGSRTTGMNHACCLRRAAFRDRGVGYITPNFRTLLASKVLSPKITLSNAFVAKRQLLHAMFSSSSPLAFTQREQLADVCLRPCTFDQDLNRRSGQAMSAASLVLAVTCVITHKISVLHRTSFLQSIAMKAYSLKSKARAQEHLFLRLFALQRLKNFYRMH
jgi:hypothetical protein